MAKRAAGRPRQGRIDVALTETVPKLLRERGYRGVTVEAIATAAGIGKPAIYRRYRSKAELVFAVVIHADEPEVPDEGNFAADITWLVNRAHEDLMRAAATMMPGFLADVLEDRELTVRFRHTFIAAQRDAVTVVCRRAVDRGELQASPAAELAHSLLVGPIFMRLLILGETMSPLQLRDHAEAVVRSLAA